MDRTIGEWQQILDLGEGSFGVVSLWRNKASNKTIAIKRCKRVSLSTKQKERWCNEVEMLKTMKHENIVSYEMLPIELEQGIQNPSNLPLLSMEYCSGGNLRYLLKHPCNASGLQECDIRAILEDMMEALLYLHQLDIAHRDFKPENIVLKANADRKSGVIYKLIDLGFAKELDGTLSIVGTMDYVAPEILQGQKYNIGVDYWSFGIVTYEIICGNKKYPFPSDGPLIDRLKCLEMKKENHITALTDSSRRINYFSKITSKCHISSWFKESIEDWLQKPLQYDKNKRFRSNPFKDLKLLLKRDILTVFSVYTLEFYYYEINDSILISTLKTWISRDTKIEPTNQLLLTKKNSSSPSDNQLINTLIDDDLTVYVFNKCFLWNNFAKLPSPDFVTDNMKTIDMSTALSSTIHCIFTERKHFSAISNSLQVLNEHIKLIFHETFTQYERLYLIHYKVMALIEFCNNMKTESKNFIEAETEINLMYLTSVVRNLSTKISKLQARIAQLKNCEQMMNKKFQDLNAVVLHHLGELKRGINGASAKITSVENSQVGRVAFEVVSGIIKNRHGILRYLKSEIKIQTFAMEEISKLKVWMSGLEENINKTISSLQTLQLLARSDAPVQNMKNENGSLDYKRLIKDNKIGRLRLEDAINSGLFRFRVQCEFIENFLNTIPK